MYKACQRTLHYIKRTLDVEKSKWESGMSNDYYQWEDLYNSFKETYQKYLREDK